MKRIVLFLITNLLVVTMLGIVVRLFGLEIYTSEYGINLTGLLIFSALLGFGGAFFSLAISRMAAKWMMGVRVLNPSGNLHPTEKWVLDTTHDLCRKAGLKKMPEVGIYDSQEVNAFATGPSASRSLVAVSTGLLGHMRQDEIEGVLAHEVAHIKNGDMVTMTLLQGVINTFVIFLSRIIAFAVSRLVREELGSIVFFLVSIVLQIGLSILGMMVVMAYSRAREFRADAGASELAGKGKMVAALQSLSSSKGLVDHRQAALETMKISGGKGLMALFSSHPPLEERIAKLQSS
jgi:heat shock protein HtpX